MERTNVFYITEEEKLTILRNRLEAERKANKKHLSANEKLHRFLGALLLIFAVIFLAIGGEGIIGTIICAFMALVCFGAREEDRKTWVEQ